MVGPAYQMHIVDLVVLVGFICWRYLICWCSLVEGKGEYGRERERGKKKKTLKYTLIKIWYFNKI